MINRNNIVEYIKFLYQKKYNQVAPQDLLDSWSDLNDNETAIHLNGLYSSWNLDSITCKKYEVEFLSQSAQTPRTPIIPKIEQNNYAGQQSTQQEPQRSHAVPPPPTQKPKSSGGKGVLYTLLTVAILGAVGYYVWSLNNKSTDAPPDVVATNTANEKVETPTAAVAVVEPKEPEQTEADKKNARVIHDLLNAEGTRNFEAIYSAFDPNMERYWDINFPTYDEIKARYERTWEITENNEHQNVRVNKVADNTYDVMSTYSYYSLKDEKQKRVDSKVRFVFSDNNKIIKTYGL